MNKESEFWVVEWSEGNKQFHVDRLEKSWQSNTQCFLERRPQEWVVLAVFTSREPVDEFIDLLCKARGLEWNGDACQYRESRRVGPLTVQQWLERSPESNKGRPLPFPPDGDIEIGKVLYSEEDDAFKIRMGNGQFGTYDMAADRILSGAALLDFILQIHHKEWITGEHLKDLLDCITCWAYREHGKFPQEFFDTIGRMNSGLDCP